MHKIDYNELEVMNIMENKIYDKLIKKFLTNADSLDSSEKKAVISIFALNVNYCFIQFFYMVFFQIQKIPQMVFVNFTSIIFCIVTIYILCDLKKLSLGLLLWVVNSCYYILAINYILGYDKNSIVFLPVLLLLVYFLFPKKKEYLYLNTVIIFLTYCFSLYIKYNIESIYNDMFPFIETINTTSSLLLATLIIYLKSHSDNLVSNYKNKVDGLVEEVGTLTTKANIDFMTGLWNRRYVENQFLSDNFEDSYVILADLDYFKKVNDTYGHACGDYVLKEVSLMFKTAFRNTDTVSRWGGEEFLILLKHANGVNVEDKLDRLRKIIEETNFEYNDYIFTVTITNGYTYINQYI